MCNVYALSTDEAHNTLSIIYQLENYVQFRDKLTTSDIRGEYANGIETNTCIFELPQPSTSGQQQEPVAPLDTIDLQALTDRSVWSILEWCQSIVRKSQQLVNVSDEFDFPRTSQTHKQRTQWTHLCYDKKNSEKK